MAPRGSSRFQLKNWFPSVVRSSGAVSPPARATERTKPVMIPALALGRTTLITMRHFGTPKASAASRRV